MKDLVFATHNAHKLEEIRAILKEYNILGLNDINCHTDITIPYGEIGEISSLKKDGSKTVLIKDGRFVLPGTEELNKPLDEYEALK